MNKIYLSPSVQEDNVGKGDYRTEEDRMNQIADVVERELRKSFEVFRNNREWGLAQIVSDSNAKGVDIHVAIHSNASNGTARGCEVFAYSKESDGNRLAQLIYNRIEVITPSADRGVKYDPTLYELKNTNAPAILAEIAFHDNLEDANWIINNIEKIGIEIAKGIYEYFGVAFDGEEKPTPAPQPTQNQNSTVLDFQKWLNAAYGTGIAEDNIFGAETLKASVKALQTELNKQFNRGLVVDGIFGNLTRNAIVEIEKGDEGNITKTVQGMLICRGYILGQLDGDFGNATENAAKAFQKDNGLVVDGICGINTFSKLFA